MRNVDHRPIPPRLPKEGADIFLSVERPAARSWHALTSVVAAGAVVLQFVLVLEGHRQSLGGADVAQRVDLGAQVVRFCSFMTIWFNVIIAGTCAVLAVDPAHDGRVWRALRLDGVVIGVVGGVVHWFLLRPLMHLTGLDYLADKLLHIAVPLLAAVGWLLFGPRDRVDPRDLAAFMVVPGGWLAYTLIRGAIVHWYPYPFINVDSHGYGFVAAVSLALAALLLASAAGAMWLDRRLPVGVRSSPIVPAAP